MGGEAPQDVLLGPDFSDIQAVRVQVINLSKSTALNQLLQLQDGRVIPEDMPDHQDPSVRRRELDETFPMLDLDGQRLFDEDILARLKCRLRHLVVGDGRRCQCNCVDRRIGENGLEVAEEPDVFILMPAGVFSQRMGVAEPGKRSELIEIPHNVFAPVADADDGYCDGRFLRTFHVGCLSHRDVLFRRPS